MVSKPAFLLLNLFLGCWYGDLGSNCDYVVEAASHARGLGVNVGIYSSEGEWSATVGSDCNRLTSYPLW